ncbi:Neuropeptide-like protein, partial [Ooceraea biroi]
VTCLDEEGTQQCIPKKIFMELIRLPEFSSGIAAYMRTTRVAQRTKGYNDIDHLKVQFSSPENDDAEICIPASVYLELLRDPALRGYLSVMARTHKLLEFPGSLLNSSEEADSRELTREAEKRSLATLAKNGDLPSLPIATQEREGDGDDEEKRSDLSNDNVNGLMPILMDDDRRRMPEVYDYLPVDLDPEVPEYSLDKRNVGSLARDFALPTGRRHIGSVVRDYGLPSGKRNIGSLARQSMLPSGGKRNVASLARYYLLPQAGKRNVAALARDASLPYGKRYLGSLIRSSGYPVRGYDEGKRSVASLARNADWPFLAKRGGTAGGKMIVLGMLNRHGRSLNDDREVHNEPLDLQQLIRQNGDQIKEDVPQWWAIPSMSESLDETKTRNRSNRRIDGASQTRYKRQIDFSDEYPLSVMQNTNMLEYEDMIESFPDHYPEKRFMGSAPEMPADSAGYPEVLRAKNATENPADGSSSNYTPNSSTRSLRPMFTLKTRLQSLRGDCHQGFKRFLLLPDADNFLRTPNSHIMPRSM